MGVSAGQLRWRPVIKSVVFGAMASAALLVLYLGTIALAQDWPHARWQWAEDRLFIIPLVVGFGTQVGLFVYLRTLHARAQGTAIAASTGTSTTAMLACCAHHLADVLPVLGLSGAAVFLDAYKSELLWLALAMNVVGIVYLLWLVTRQMRLMSPAGAAAACHSPADRLV
ncbi:MAG TPA: hypothetical protein PKA95_00695 [Thermomicrobiales bacterium]|nr:hypothetical protein [Thermomicrobiales bacterium]